MSEWGNPRRFDRQSCTEFIGAAKPTRGSETSQYPEERKSKETPLVAASERGSGQTEGIRPFGVVGLQRGIREGSGSIWKGARYRVIGPYANLNLTLGSS
jgi:hypothetical protein